MAETPFDVPIDPDSTAAIIVDMQNDYVHPEGGLPSALGYDTVRLERDADRMAQFLDAWRDRGLQVVHVQTHQSAATNSTVWARRYPDRDIAICEPGSWGADFYDDLTPGEDEPVVTKHRYSGFADTNLDLVLRSNGIETLVMCGCLTHVCVEATGRDAFHRDYWVTFLEDCCSTTDAYTELHEATLQNMDSFYGEVTTSDELVDAIDRQTVSENPPATD